MTISILNDYKIFDAGSKSSVEEIIQKINIKSNAVVINFSKCIIDYPATSLIIDKVLVGLVKQTAPRILIIQTHLNILEILLLHWLFIGSSFFQTDDSKKKESPDAFKEILNEKLKSSKMSIRIEIIDRNGKKAKEYSYGSK